MKVLLAYPGTQHFFHLARELDRRGVLETFCTGAAVRSGSFFQKLGQVVPGLGKRISNRELPSNFSANLKTRPILELLAQWRLKRGQDEQAVMQQRNEAFQRSIPEKALLKVDAVIGVDTASWILADRSRKIGRPFVLDQTIGHPDAKQAMHDEMRSRFPSWTEGFETRRPDVRAEEIKEQADATLVVTASSFARQTLLEHGVPAENVQVIPYGVDAVQFTPRRSVNERPFRFVFIGLLTARKGIPLLLEAWKKLGTREAELWLVGSASRQARALIPDLDGLRCVGAIPSKGIPQLLGQCDVFVFPSFFEGFGLVLLEAMACGLPVITTTTTAGPDIVSENEDGWIIDPGNLDALVNAMQHCLQNKDRIHEMGMNARATAERFSWNTYGGRWIELLQQVTGER